jgi:hypothetical protein
MLSTYIRQIYLASGILLFCYKLQSACTFTIHSSSLIQLKIKSIHHHDDGYGINNNQSIYPHCCLQLQTTTDNDTNTNDTINPHPTSDDIITTIQIPQHYPHRTTPLHQSTYPSLLHNIHIYNNLLTPQQASHCLNLAKQHAEMTKCWTKGKDSERHSAYATVDFPVEDCKSLDSYLKNELKLYDRIFEILSDLYQVDVNDLSFLDLFCAHYQAKKPISNATEMNINNDNDENYYYTMDRLKPHRDGSLLSFTIVLSTPQSYQGGGTTFDALRDVNPSHHPQYNGTLRKGGVVRVTKQGDAVLHSGKVLHGADVVTSGERTVLVGFVDVADWNFRDGVLSQACKEWGRMDVASFRLKRQEQMIATLSECNNNNSNNSNGDDVSNADNVFCEGWNSESSSLMNSRSNSILTGFIPGFTSVYKRGNVEYQRRKRLETEDILLRDILRPRDELDDLKSYFGDDITIL